MLAFILGSKYSLGELILHYWPVFPVALAAALITTPICRIVALRFGIVDIPDDTVKTHKNPTAYLGGIAILAGSLAGLGAGIYLLLTVGSHVSPDVEPQTGGFDTDRFNWLMLVGIASGAIIATAVGIVDDVRNLKPMPKFIGQAIAAAVLVVVGVCPNIVDGLQYVGIDNAPSMLNYVLGVPIVLFFILGATNSLNLLDGLDGLCVGVTGIITIALFALATILATWAHSPVGDPIRLILSLSLMGGALGFLPWNRHPAKIFMGDGGSMLLGFVAGTLMILFTERVGAWSVAAIIVFGLPILDTAVALVRRFVHRQPLFVSDRGHIYDQLMDRGLGLKKTVTISYLLATVYVLIGLSTSILRLRYAVVIFVLVFMVSAYTVWAKGFIAYSKPK